MLRSSSRPVIDIFHGGDVGALGSRHGIFKFGNRGEQEVAHPVPSLNNLMSQL